MRTFDLSPLFRSTVGFDHLARMLDSAARLDEQAATYPPYNIEKVDEEAYRIVMAVAGFAEEDLRITSEGNRLTIIGTSRKDQDSIEYLHRGIAGRSFERRFDLADHIHVENASIINGLLHINLKRIIPEAMRPRTIPIGGNASTVTLDSPEETRETFKIAAI